MVAADGERSDRGRRRFRRPGGGEDARGAPGGAGHHRRSTKSSPLPAAAVSGGHGGPEPGGHRRAGARAVHPGRERERAIGTRRRRRSRAATDRAGRRDEASVGLPDPRLRSPAQLLRASGMGGVRPGTEDARASHGDPPAHPLRLRVGGERARCFRAAAAPHVRDRRRRADGRRARAARRTICARSASRCARLRR